MALDLYAGPLCRYYARDWENQVQQRFGASVTQIGPNGPLRKEDPRGLVNVIRGWQRVITPVLRGGGFAGRIEWDERARGAYYTTQIKWGPYWALRTWAAYSEFAELTRPAEPPADLERDAGLECIRASPLTSAYPHLHSCEMWLPLDLPKPLVMETPAGARRPVGSARGLLSELERLGRETFRSPAPPPGAGEIGRFEREGKTPLEKFARVGWALMREGAQAGLAMPAPLVMDY